MIHPQAATSGGRLNSLAMPEDFRTLYPTWGDLAREQSRRLGIPYSGHVDAGIRARVARLAPPAQQAFAASCAERLMRRHEARPPEQQIAFALEWRPALDAIWEGLEAPSESVVLRVRAVLDAFHRSPYDQEFGEAPEGADDRTAECCIYACECFLGEDRESAYWAASVAEADADAIAYEELGLDLNDFAWDPGAAPMPIIRLWLHPAVQEEIRRQLSDLELLETAGRIDRSVIEQLRR